MLTVCICDDNPSDAAQIQALTQRFAVAHPEYPLRIQFFPSAYDLLDYLDKQGGFDLYLLDILMPHLMGLEVAERIRARGEAVEILFLTVSREYALDAFEVDAGGYLVKPLKWERFEQVLLAAVRRLSAPEVSYITLKTREGLRKLLLRDLVSVESFNHERICTLADGSRLVTPDTLTSLMERLSCDTRFFSPHRAYIINLEHIAALDAAFVLMSTGLRVPVPRASAVALKQAYLDYLF